MAPCYDKKLEALREGLSTTLNGARGTDCVLTSGERGPAALTGQCGTESQGLLGSQWPKVKKKVLQSLFPDESGLWESHTDRVPPTLFPVEGKSACAHR